MKSKGWLTFTILYMHKSQNLFCPIDAAMQQLIFFPFFVFLPNEKSGVV